MSIKIFSFQKNEELLGDWIKHHGDIFGYGNIHIIDHGSRADIKEIYTKYIPNGLVISEYSGKFENKAAILTKTMKQYKGDSDFLIPIDGDEFIYYNNNNGNIIYDGANVIKHINNLKGTVAKFKMDMYHNLLTTIECDNAYKECVYFRKQSGKLDRKKTFFPTNHFVNTDQGNHFGKINKNDNHLLLTNIILLHYPRKGYSNYVKKLKRGVEAYKNNTILGTHWFRDYDKYKNGTLEEHYKKHYMYDKNDGTVIKITTR